MKPCIECGKSKKRFKKFVILDEFLVRISECDNCGTEVKTHFPLVSKKPNEYVQIYIGRKMGMAQMHRIVWETHHNKELPSYEHVHHLNSIRGDNRPSNLMNIAVGKHNVALHPNNLIMKNKVLTRKVKELEDIIAEKNMELSALRSQVAKQK